MNDWQPVTRSVSSERTSELGDVVGGAQPPIAPPTSSTRRLDLDVLAQMGEGAPLPGRSRVTNTFTFVLLGLLGIAGSFSVGAWYQREYGAAKTTIASSGSPAAGPAVAGAAPSGSINAVGGPANRGGIGQTGSGGSASGASVSGASVPGAATGPQASATSVPAAAGGTVGTVKLVDGTNVYIADATGAIVKVTTQASTAVNVSKTGSVADLKPGDTVVVQGATGADGFIAASSIRQR